MTALLLVGDVHERQTELIAAGEKFDLIITSPPFLALRSYLPDDHPDKAKEIGSEATPAEYLDVLLQLTAEWRQLLAPHGSLAVELGDTYAGSGGAGGDWSDSPATTKARVNGGSDSGPVRRDTTTGWPLDKSLCGIPTLYTWSLAYGRNLLTGQPSPAGQWRIRNLKPWIRTNPPVGALGDKERPATSYITVACLARDRWFDLDAVRTQATQDPATYTGNGYTKGSPQGVKGNEAMTGNPGGAPPLDWWHPIDATIDAVLQQRARDAGKPSLSGSGSKREAKTDGGWSTLPPITKELQGANGHHIRRALEKAGILPPHPDALDISPRGYSGTTPTSRLVPCGPHDGGQRTTSRGCPMHGDRPAPPRRAPDDAHAESPATRTPHTDGRHAQARLAGFAATDPQLELTTAEPNSDSPPQQCAPAATPHDTESSRTDPAPLTNPPGTPSAETTDRTAHTSTSPSSDAPNPGIRPSSTAEACQDGDSPGTAGRTAGTSSALPDGACTCSYHKAVKDTESTSHYAVWPPQLVRQLVDEMCPRRVCTTCGVPSRRITENDPAYQAFRDKQNASYAARDNSKLGVRAASGSPGAWDNVTQNINGASRKTVGWSDCGHNSWRPGRILDPFSGSGTTLATATGMGRDAVGIDLDPRNAALTEQRCGMFLTINWGGYEPTTELPPAEIIAAVEGDRL